MAEIQFHRPVLKAIGKSPYSLEEVSDLLKIPYTIFLQCLRGEEDWGDVTISRLSQILECKPEELE